MELKTLLSVAAGIAAFFIAFKTGSKLKAIFIPAGVAGVLTVLPVLVDPKSLGYFGPIGLLVFILLASVVPVFSAAIGCGVGFAMQDPPRFKEIWLAPKNIRAITASTIGILLMCVAYIAILTTHEESPYLFLYPIGLLMLLYGISKLFKK